LAPSDNGSQPHDDVWSASRAASSSVAAQVAAAVAGEEAAVIFRTVGAGGNVHLDAVQVLQAK